MRGKNYASKHTDKCVKCPPEGQRMEYFSLPGWLQEGQRSNVNSLEGWVDVGKGWGGSLDRDGSLRKDMPEISSWYVVCLFVSGLFVYFVL